ncbi:amidohydrolase [Pseudoalteromonas maricaloris]|uniref:amidohydrolase family protein n=1 Tax=Pseudoalteromonas maricaloris TaxID=184924 RepID=UPI0021AE1981|nr:amidohydrolase family protein [Pseudoalteromonas flavipulchra]USE68753.1 amidohydrolase [Pseudoalteromonas flavipulchra]
MKKRNIIPCFAAALLISACSSSTNNSDDKPKDEDVSAKVSLFFGGNIITVASKKPFSLGADENPAVLVENGVITFVGSVDDAKEKLATIRNHAPKTKISYFNLNGRTLMPGFIEPHAHLQSTAQMSGVKNLMPCLPDKYQEKLSKDYGWIYYPNKNASSAKDGQGHCFIYLDEAIAKVTTSPPFVIDHVNKVGWYIGNGLDPSRMVQEEYAKRPFDQRINENREFFAYPMKAIDEIDNQKLKTAQSNKAIFMTDQSGHLAYANMSAFEQVGLCNTVVKKAQIDMISQAKVDEFEKENPDFKLPVEDYTLTCEGTEQDVKTSQFIVKTLCFSDGDLDIVNNAEYKEIDSQKWQYSGLIKEPSAYMLFINSILRAKGTSSKDISALVHHTPNTPPATSCPLDTAQPELAKYDKDENEEVLMKMKYLLNTSSQQGVTMLVDGGSTTEMKDDFINLVLMEQLQPAARVRSVYDWRNYQDEATAARAQCVYDPKNPSECDYIPFESKAFNGMYSAQGIKLLSDGSTQGCSANLSTDYSEAGLCDTFGKGHVDYTKNEIVQNLSRFLPTCDSSVHQPWYFNLHANGDQAISDSLNALTQMAGDAKRHTSTCKEKQVAQTFTDLAHTIIHSTVNDIDESTKENKTIYKYLKARETFPNLTPSHLIAHVAYWGASMRNELGDLRGNRIDPMEEELAAGIPFSLHSDLSISPLFPLWFIEQAMTRHTWEYPFLASRGKYLGTNTDGKSNLSIQDAIKAVTIVPAMQHNLSHKLGSIEVGKIADLIVLDKNLMDFQTTPESIHSINVECAFINGDEVTWVDLEDLGKAKNLTDYTPKTLASKCRNSSTLN